MSSIPRTPLLPWLVAALCLALVPVTIAAAGAGTKPRPSGGYLEPKGQQSRGPGSFALAVRGKASRVKVRAHGASAFGRFAPHFSSTSLRGKIWDFGARKKNRTPRMKALLDKVFKEYGNYGAVDFRVQVYDGKGRRSDWSCVLTNRVAGTNCGRR